jgi:hypothetical protein
MSCAAIMPSISSLLLRFLPDAYLLIPLAVPIPKRIPCHTAFVARSTALIEGVFSRSPVVHGDHSDSPVFLPDATERYKLVAMSARAYLPAYIAKAAQLAFDAQCIPTEGSLLRKETSKGVSGQAARAGGTTT